MLESSIDILKLHFFYWIVDLFFIVLTVLLVFIYKGIILFISHVSKQRVCACACVCVCISTRAHEKEKRFYYAVWCHWFHYFRGTPKENYVILGTPVRRECCIAEHKQAVRHRVVQSGFAELDQLVKLFIVLYQMLWLVRRF